MNDRHTIIIIFLTGLMLWSCGGIHSATNVDWRAQPEFIEADNALFRARIEPQKGATPFYTFFLLTLTNKSDTDLIIDWNASQYLFNGKPNGVLVFEGIDPASIKTATVPLETIRPGAVFSREIMPMRLIAWNPVTESTASRRSINPGMIPAGENGVRLAVRHANGQMTIPLSVRIIQTNSP